MNLLYICPYLLQMIIKSKGQWQVRSRAGKLLGTHESREKASRQLAAIEASKARRGEK
jgi:hypothetical protein